MNISRLKNSIINEFLNEKNLFHLFSYVALYLLRINRKITNFTYIWKFFKFDLLENEKVLKKKKIILFLHVEVLSARDFRDTLYM